MDRPNQVWATDIRYISMRKGFMYLIAIIDLHRRYVLDWSVSNTIDVYRYKDTLEEALALHGTPDYNYRSGSKFISKVLTKCVSSNKIQLSMDGKGRVIDKVLMEAL